MPHSLPARLQRSEVDNHGLVRCGEQSGEAAITVNYMGKVGVVRIQRPRTTAANFRATYPVHNRIDELVWNKLDRMGLAPRRYATMPHFCAGFTWM